MGCTVSIIVPIYNAEKYIDRCIASIQNQTYRDLQIILVNDGSTDASYEVCKNYALEDARITLVTQENQGVVVARKKGVQEATGDFVCWVDADDWIERDYIETMLSLQRETCAEIVALAHYHDIGEDSTLIRNGIERGVYNVKDIIHRMLYTGKFYEYGIGPHLCTKLFSIDIIKKTQAEVTESIIAGDDAAVTYPSILEAKKVCVSDKAGYHYIQNPGSLTKKSFSDEKTRVDTLIGFLESKFKAKGVYEDTKNQLSVYRNYMLTLRDIEVFDDGTDCYLGPYGGITNGDKVIVYGAGVLGQKIYRYLKGVGVDIVAWMDRSWESYQEKGFDVVDSLSVATYDGKYDYIIIANITERIACDIKVYLIGQGVPEDKILWFTEAFICG